MRSTDPEFLVGQYYTEDSQTRPGVGSQNKLLEAESGAYLDQKEIGKTWVKKTIKIGHCALCWGHHHESRNDPCMYKGACRECLVRYKEMPHAGFHHSCRNLVVSTPKPNSEQEKRKRDTPEEYNPGQPKDATQASYVPSQAFLKRQKMMEEARNNQQKRKLEEEAAIAALQYEEDELEPYDGPPLTQEDIEWQDNELAKLREENQDL